MPAVAPLHLGCGPPASGNDYTYISLVHSKVECFFVLVDAHCKWPEVKEMKSTTAEKTIEVLRTLFVSYAIPEHMVSDNGPQFTSDEFMRLNTSRVHRIILQLMGWLNG